MGVKVVELAELGPTPYGAMLLADPGADVVQIDRPTGSGSGEPEDHRRDIVNRGRRSVIDIESPAGVALALELVDGADVLIDPYRPGAPSGSG